MIVVLNTQLTATQPGSSVITFQQVILYQQPSCPLSNHETMYFKAVHIDNFSNYYFANQEKYVNFFLLFNIKRIVKASPAAAQQTFHSTLLASMPI